MAIKKGGRFCRPPWFANAGELPVRHYGVKLVDRVTPENAA